MTERQIEAYLFRQTKAVGGMSIKFLTTTANGMPDRLVLLPNGRMVFVELKRKGKPPRKQQLKRHEQLRWLGFEVLVIDDIQQIHEMLGGDAT